MQNKIQTSVLTFYHPQPQSIFDGIRAFYKVTANFFHNGYTGINI